MATFWKVVCCLALLCAVVNGCLGQTSPDTLVYVTALKQQDVIRLGNQYDRFSAAVEKKTSQFLRRLQKLQSRLRLAIGGHDSVAGSQFQQAFTAVNAQFAGAAAVSSTRSYLPGIDSIQTAIRFLRSSCLSSTLPLPHQAQSLQSLDQQVSNLQGQLGRAGTIADLATRYEQEWMTKWPFLGIGSAMANWQKQVYYYKEQLQQYKSLLQDPDKLASRLLGAIRNSPAFQAYMQQHSEFSRLFNVPGSQTVSSGPGAASLQTREQVAALLAAKSGPAAALSTASAGGSTGGSGGGNPLASGMQDAQAELTQLQSKLSALGQGGNNSNTADFQPNSQHTKTFFQRLELGFNIQSTSSSVLIPAYSDIALTLGYRVNDRFVTGVGVSYKLGWGQPFNHINLSSQGAGVRSYGNWRFSNTWWVSGGLEGNYLNAFNSTAQLRSLQAWQSSALAGIMKTYQAGRRQGNIQLLYDFLHHEHIPNSPAFVFRVGYQLH